MSAADAAYVFGAPAVNWRRLTWFGGAAHVWPFRGEHVLWPWEKTREQHALEQSALVPAPALPLVYVAADSEHGTIVFRRGAIRYCAGI